MCRNCWVRPWQGLEHWPGHFLLYEDVCSSDDHVWKLKSCSNFSFWEHESFLKIVFIRVHDNKIEAKRIMNAFYINSNRNSFRHWKWILCNKRWIYQHSNFKLISSKTFYKKTEPQLEATFKKEFNKKKNVLNVTFIL